MTRLFGEGDYAQPAVRAPRLDRQSGTAGKSTNSPFNRATNASTGSTASISPALCPALQMSRQGITPSGIGERVLGSVFASRPTASIDCRIQCAGTPFIAAEATISSALATGIIDRCPSTTPLSGAA